MEVTLAPDLQQVLERQAKELGTTVNVVANDWLREHHAELYSQQLDVQTERFWAKYGEFYARYPDEYVAFYDDEVLDHDTDAHALGLRVETQYGDLPIVIAQVTAEPVREYKMISSHLSE